MSGKRIERFGIRFTTEELARLDEVVERVKKRNPYMDRSKVLREIIGFDAGGFVTEEDRVLLRGKEFPGDAKSEPPREDTRGAA